MILRIVNAILVLLTKFISCFLPFRGKVLMFHGVGDDMNDYNVTINEFQIVVDSIKQYTCIQAHEVMDSDCFVCITFDDVRASFFNNAYPILKKNNIPFTLFVATDLIGVEGFLSEQQLKELSNDTLCEIGSHTKSHRKYGYLNRKEQEIELSESKDILSKIVGYEIKSFAFPYGSITACGLKSKNLVMKYYHHGFSTIGVEFTYPRLLPKYFLPRINVDKKYVGMIIKQTVSI